VYLNCDKPNLLRNELHAPIENNESQPSPSWQISRESRSIKDHKRQIELPVKTRLSAYNKRILVCELEERMNMDGSA